MAKRFDVKLTGQQLRFLESFLDGSEPIVGWDDDEAELVDGILRACSAAEDRAANEILKRKG